MRLSLLGLGTLLLAAAPIQACDSCYGPTNLVAHERRVRRMQPTAQNATSGPTRPLEFGQLNVMQTTDTHGWLAGHLKQQTYSADWGDFVSFTRHMKQKASNLGVDLLLIDTGDLHDGAGLSDASSLNGQYSNPIFENVDYDLLTIGNHELYVSSIAYEHFYNFSSYFGDRYLTSNVEIYNPVTSQYQYLGNKYRYFSTQQGLRVMAFGVLFDFTGNSNASRVTTAANMTKQQWFIDAVNYKDPIDIFIVIGHNPVRTNASSSTFGTLYNAIRGMRADVPIQAFGGHTHIRDFVVYDSMSTGLESGRYCETVGWFAMTGINSSTYHGAAVPAGVPNPTKIAVKPVNSTASTAALSSGTGKAAAAAGGGAAGAAAAAKRAAAAPGQYRYARRYLDWNRLTFAYHANSSQNNPFDNEKGLSVTSQITADRNLLNLTSGSLYGCAPATYCQSCKPFGSPGNIFTLLQTALAATVINQTRASIPRLIIINTGSIRYDLVEGPFTLDDSFVVSPFLDAFQFIPNVPYKYASTVLATLNAGPYQKKRSIDLETESQGHIHEHQLERRDFNFQTGFEECVDPQVGYVSEAQKLNTRGVIRRQSSTLVPGYTTVDDLGSDGDDTAHSSIPYYAQPNDLQANASFPTDGSMPANVDLIFLDFIAKGYVVPALNKAGANYTINDVQYYLPPSFTTNSYLPAYAKLAWQANVPNCPIGFGVQ